MSQFDPLPDDVLELLQAACEGTLSAEQQARLDALMAADERVARHYAQWFDMHVELYFLARTRRARREALASITGGGPHLKQSRTEAAQAGATGDPESTPRPGDARRPQFRGLRGWIHDFSREPLALAVLLLAMISGGALVWQLSKLPPQQMASGGRQPPVLPEPATAQSQQGAGTAAQRRSAPRSPEAMVARLVRSVNASWQPSEPLADGAVLKAGQKLTLASGLAEITFDSGATVILEGPAEFEVGNQGSGVGGQGSGIGNQGSGIRGQGSEISRDNSCSLTLGKLVAQVPQRAHGFTVHTPTMKIVDLGTEFGVTVQAAKNLTPDPRPLTPILTEVHVLQGEVSITGTELAQAAVPPTPDSRLPTPDSRLLTPDSRLLTPDSRLPTPDLRPPILLKAGEAVTSQPVGGAPRVIKAEPSKFVRELPPEGIAHASPKRERGPLQPGDILAVTRNTLKLVKIDPKTGQQTVLVQGDRDRHGTDWMCVAVNAQGQVFVGTGRESALRGQVLRIDPRDRSIQVVASDGRLADKRVNGLTVSSDGALYAALDSAQGSDEVVRIDPRSGAVSPVVSWGDNIWGIAPDTDGRGLLAVSDLHGSVARIDGQTVSQWTRDSGAQGAHGVIVRPDGRVFVSATTESDRRCKILEVDRATHRVTEIVGMPQQYQWTLGMLAVEPDGRLIVGNSAAESTIYRVDIDARTMLPVAEGKHLERVWGVAVVPGEPAEKNTNVESGN